MRFTIDIDTGGTFTDGFFTDLTEKRTEIIKVPTTPHDLTICFLDCVKSAAERFGLSLQALLQQTGVVRFSNTIATNAIIQRSGSKLGLIVTVGHEVDLYAAGETESPAVREGFAQPDMVVGLPEQVNASGEVLLQPDPEAALAGLQDLIDRGAQAVVICLANSGLNSANEQAVKRIIKGEYPNYYLGSIPVFTASETTGRLGDALRLHTAVLNAYIHEHLAHNLYKAEEQLRAAGYGRPLLVVHNNGGAARVAKTQSLHTYNSGPVAGLLGAQGLSETNQLPHAISVDIGGTSVDIGVITDGQVNYDLTPEIADLPINLPMIRVSASGGAGGSIAWIDADDRLKVGPQSAGALPGPACFDLGGAEATVTDADVILGYVNPDYFLGGRMRLKRDKAQAAVQKIADRLGCSLEEAAWRIKQTVDQATAENIRRVAAANGLAENELREAVLVVYGGAGPTHAAGLLAALRARRALTTPHSPVFSAFSSSTMDVMHTYSAAARLTLAGNGASPVTPEEFNALVQPLVARAQRDMQGEGFATDAVRYGLELLVENQSGEVAVTSPKVLPETATDMRELAITCRQVVGLGQRQPVVVTQLTLRATAEAPHFTSVEQALTGPDPSEAQKGLREVYWGPETGRLATALYERSQLRPGNCVAGPAIIEGEDTTYVVPPGFSFVIDRYLNGFLEQASCGEAGPGQRPSRKRTKRASRKRFQGKDAAGGQPQPAARVAVATTMSPVASPPAPPHSRRENGAGEQRALVRRPAILPAVGPDVARFAGVSKVFITPAGMVPALDNVSFSIREGEFVCLVGASGCGKTTALRLMAALDSLSSGMIYLDGLPLTGPSEKIGFVFQQPNLLPWRTILQNVILPLTVQKEIPREDAEVRGMQMLDLVGLTEFAHHHPRELSGGMQQRAGIVRALINDPELLLMDEPFGALDAITREELNLELLHIWRQSGKTILFVTHSITEAVFLSDRVYVMTPRPGRIAAEFEVPLARPRTPDLGRDATFQDVVAEVRRAI